MAEIQKPEYKGTKRLNIASAKATGRTASNKSLPQFQPTHEMKMAEIVAKGTLDIIDAYQAAKQTAVRLEVSEEKARLDKHIGEQRIKVNRNIITARPNQLLAGDLESNFIRDGHKIGEDTITAYVASEDISPEAAKLIQPAIDAANNSFNIDTQSTFTKELVDRSKIAIKMRRNRDLNSFQNYMTETTRDGVENPSALYAPNKNEVAEYTAKQYDAFLQIEIKNKNLNDKQAELMLHEFKEELAGTILNRHLAQNPTEALKQYTEGAYMVGGVPVDSARIAKTVDSLIKSKENKRIADESNAYSIRMMSYAVQQSQEVLSKFSDDINEENHRMMQSRIASGKFEDYDKALMSEEDTRRYVPNYAMLNDDNPYLTKELLERMVITAVKGQKALEDVRRKRKGALFLVELESALHSPTFQYSEHYKVQNYNWVDGKGWRPKQYAIDKTARTYGIHPDTVKTAMIKAISRHKTNVKPGSGMIGGPKAFKIFQNELLQYWNDKIFEDNGLEDSERALRKRAKLEGTDLPEPYIQDPLKLSPGKENYQQMNQVERYTINAMVTDLMNLKDDYRNTNNLSMPDMIERYNYWNDRFMNQDHTYEIQGKVWRNIKNVLWNVRLKDLQEIPKVTAANDVKLLDKMLKMPHIQLDQDEKDLYFERLKFLDGGVGNILKHGTKRNHPNNYIIEKVWNNILEKEGAFEAKRIQKEKALEQAKL